MDRRSFLLAAAGGFAGRRLLSAGTSEPPPAVRRNEIHWWRWGSDDSDEVGWIGGANGTLSYFVIRQDLTDFWRVVRHRTDGVFEHLCGATSLDIGKFVGEQHHAWLPYNMDIDSYFNRVGRRLQWMVALDRSLAGYATTRHGWVRYIAKVDAQLFKIMLWPPNNTVGGELVRNQPLMRPTNMFDIMLAAEVDLS